MIDRDAKTKRSRTISSRRSRLAERRPFFNAAVALNIVVPEADRGAAFRFLGTLPTDLVEGGDPDLEFDDFKLSLDSYLEEHDFQPDRVQVKLKRTLFKMTCCYLREKKALPEMLQMVKSRDWKARENLLRRLVEKEIPKVQDGLSKLEKKHGQLSKEVTLWISRQVKIVMGTVWFAHAVQLVESYAVSSMSKPPVDSQFMWVLREALRSHMRRTTVADIDIIVAACAVAANIFSDRDDAADIISRIPMRISRTKKSFQKQFEKAVLSGIRLIPNVRIIKLKKSGVERNDWGTWRDSASKRSSRTDRGLDRGRSVPRRKPPRTCSAR